MPSITTRHAACVALLGLAAGCTDGGTYPVGVAWELTTFQSSQVTASPGDHLVLTWEYSTDDPVTSQQVCFRYPYFNAIGQECFVVPVDEREVDFDHPGAFTAHLMANSDYQHTEGALQVNDRKESFMTATWVASDPQRPRLGTETVMHFTQFVALYDDDNDTKIDGLVPLYPVDEDWHFFRARTASPYEGSGGVYPYYQGPSFPLTTPYPNPNDGTPDYANVVVHGGGLVITGGEEQNLYKPSSEDGEGVFVVGDELHFERVFLQLSYLWGPTTGVITHTDIEVGNLEQGLVLGISSVGTSLGSYGDPHLMGIEPDALDTLHTAGSIKGASVSNFVTPALGDPTNVFVHLDSVEWQMPLFNDEELGDNSIFEWLLEDPAPAMEDTGTAEETSP